MTAVRVLLATCALFTLALSSCPANYAIPYLVADSRELTGQQMSQQFEYSLPAAMPATPTVAIAVQDFALVVEDVPTFRLIPHSVRSTAIVFRYERSSAWRRVRMNFWVSANEHILLGCFHTDQVSVEHSRAQVKTAINRPFKEEEKPVVRTFISGYEGTSDEVQIMVSPVGLEGTSLAIGLTVGPRTNITGITISYIAFSPSTAPFVSYGGSFSRNRFTGAVEKDIAHNIYRTPFLLVGVAQLSIVSSHPLDFSCRISESFLMKVSATRMIDSFALTYVAVGKQPDQLCSHCGSNYSPYEDECQLKCPNGTETVKYASGGAACKGSTGTPPSLVPESREPRTCPANAFDNGYECVCEVGFGYIRGHCTSLKTYKSIVTTNSTTTTTTTTTTTVINKPPPHRPPVPTYPVQPPVTPQPVACPAGYQRINGNCVKLQVECPPGSHSNGVGSCICPDGYYLHEGQCAKQQACPSYQIQQPDGSCACDVGLTQFGGYCAKCPRGALWSSQSGRCIYICGQNSVYSAQAGKCVCNPGFGMKDKVCQICPKNHFVSQGYCVTCPLYSHYSHNDGKCHCSEGYYTNEYGVCQEKCQINQIYDHQKKQCRCREGLGKINGVCSICPPGSTPNGNGQACNSCRPNEELKGGKCVCMRGYAYNSAGHCAACSTLPSGFIINGVCSVCPSELVYDGRSGCKCPAGKTLQGSRCVSDCKSDELIDRDGNCYRCPANKMLSNGRCICKPGFVSDSCGSCKLECPQGHFQFQGTCAACPLNTIYNSQTKGCTCPSDHYKNSYGVCEKLVLNPVNCPNGQYFDSSVGCVGCQSPCDNCLSATQCLTCRQAGYEVNGNGQCIPKCGDGVIVAPQTCDSGTALVAGCVSCRIVSGWQCSGSPSVCNPITRPPISPPVPPVTPTPPRGPTLTQEGRVNINSNNVFISLRTFPTFTFANPTEMQSFIKASFHDHLQPTVYCAQRDSPELDIFDCLLIYPSGVPNTEFEVDFKYDYEGKKAGAEIKVDPLSAVHNSRTLSRVGRSSRA